MKERYIQKPPEKEHRENDLKEKLNGHGSLEGYILEELNFDSISEATYTKHSPLKNDKQIPLFAVKDIIAVDTVETSLVNKLNLLGYRFWHKGVDYEAGNYNLVKSLLPEGLVRIDDTVDDVLNNDELFDLYEKVDMTENVVNQIIKPGPNYIERFKEGAKAVAKLASYEKSEQEIVDLERGINKYAYKATLKPLPNYDEEYLNEVEFLGGLGLYAKEISGILNISSDKIFRYLSALYYDGRLKPQPEKAKANRKFQKFARLVEEIRNEDEEITDSEIADRLEVSRSKVTTVTRILIPLGRIKPRNMSSSLRRLHKTDDRVEMVRKALREIMINNPEKEIVMQDINILLNTNFPISTLLKDYHEVKKSEEVPELKYRLK